MNVKKMIWALLACSSLGLMAAKFIASGVLVLLVATWNLLRQAEGERNWKLIQSALSDYDEIIAGVRWVGKDAEVLASERVGNSAGPVRFEHVCRTQNGAWFVLHVAVSTGRVVERWLTPLDEAQAKVRLQAHKDVYVRCFGEPQVA